MSSDFHILFQLHFVNSSSRCGILQRFTTFSCPFFWPSCPRCPLLFLRSGHEKLPKKLQKSHFSIFEKWPQNRPRGARPAPLFTCIIPPASTRSSLYCLLPFPASGSVSGHKKGAASKEAAPRYEFLRRSCSQSAGTTSGCIPWPQTSGLSCPQRAPVYRTRSS